MEENVIECGGAEREGGGVCACACAGRGQGGPGLGVLAQVQRAYEERMDLVERVGGNKKLQMQVEVLRSWVGDLVGQNALLARAVQELEAEAAARLLLERTRHAEKEVELRAEVSALRRRLARKDSDLRGLVEVLRRLREFDYCTLDGIHFFEVTESDIFGTVQWRQNKLEQGDLRRNNIKHEPNRIRQVKKTPCNYKELMTLTDNLQKENLAKEREIRRLNKDVHQYEQTISNLRNEISVCKYHIPNCSKNDAEVMAGMCSTRTECGALEAVNYGSMLMEEAGKYQDRIHKMEVNLKSAGENVRALRKVNAALSEELHALRRVCAALDDQARAAAQRATFRDEIIREMRRQLKQAKAKLSKETGSTSIKSQKDYMDGDHKLRGSTGSCGSLSGACVRQQPRRARAAAAAPPPPASPSAEAPLHPDSDDCRTPRFDGSGDDMTQAATSTPGCSAELCVVANNPGVSGIERSTSGPSMMSDHSIEELGRELFLCKKCLTPSSTTQPCLHLQNSTSKTLPCTPRPCPKPRTFSLLRKYLDPCNDLEIGSNNSGPFTSKDCPARSPSLASPCLSTSASPRSCSPKQCLDSLASCSSKPCPAPRRSKTTLLNKYLDPRCDLETWSVNSGPSTSKASSTGSPRPCSPKLSLLSCSPKPYPGSPTPVDPKASSDSFICPCPSSSIASPTKPTSGSPRSGCSMPCADSLAICPCPSSSTSVCGSQRPPPGSPKSSTVTDCLIGSPCSRSTKVCEESPNASNVKDEAVARQCLKLPEPATYSFACSCSRNAQVQNPELTDRGEMCAENEEELGLITEHKLSTVSVDWKQCLDNACLQSFESAKHISCKGGSPTAVKMEPQGAECCSTRLDVYESASSGVEASAGGGGGAGTCAAARAQYYHNKLLATLHVLANTEETVRVQGESLSVAEARIAALAARALGTRRQLDRTTHELRTLRNSKKDCQHANKTEVAVQVEEVDKQKNIVRTLQTNLSVIEDLYRECFYETAKQEELIDMLRNSYLDVRLMDKEKCDQIGRLQNVINTQKWSLDRCQDIAVDVENLKLEISNFISNSNNDSGMWERSEDSLVSEVGEDLQDIVDQLVQLRDLLACECTCGLADENRKLKELNDAMRREVGELCKRTCDMEATVQERDSMIKHMTKLTHEKEEELLNARQQIKCLEDKEKERNSSCECLDLQLQQMQVLLKDKSEELERVHRQRAESEAAACRLRQELEKADQVIKENCAIRGEVSRLTQQVSRWRSQLEHSEARVRGVEADLVRARAHCRGIDLSYREKVRCAAALQAQLEEAHARGAALCAESRRVVAAVRAGLRDMRAANRAQEEKIEEQQSFISSLQQRLRDKDNVSRFPTPPPCSEMSQTDATGIREIGCSRCARERTSREEVAGSAVPSTSRYTTGRSETASCDCRRSARSGSERASSSTPVPPLRLLRKKLPICGDKRCAMRRRREAHTQHPTRDEAGTGTGAPPDPVCHHVRHMRVASVPAILRGVSPGEELLASVERLHGALAAGHRRWRRGRAHPPPV